ncbi:ankyrin repeat protein [Cupriavidus gilardii J11]|uniref:Ankyrin repeat protein n=1 Tax=Cupriavidus gilardii J11 TaxID=936133 RepID=A0A562BWH5_9BURK|nr:ankyrin repeat domain-containing protein [Cupriavidus gilardii]TWG89160.1 ankyrin repeat protein [Cupriavidus gilardii J11]
MEPSLKLFRNSAVESNLPAESAWQCLADAIHRRDETAVLAGMQACRHLLCDDDRRWLHVLLGRLVEEGFEAPAIDACVAMGADIRHVDETGRTLLHRAIESGRHAHHADSIEPADHPRISMATLEYLADRGGRALLEAQDEDGQTPLMVALGDNDIAAWLLRQGVCIDTVDKSGNTGLLRSIAAGASATVQWLLAQGAEPLRTARPDGMNAITLAAHRLDRAMVRLLIQQGVPISATDALGRTVLHAVAMLPAGTSGAIEFARDLLDSGAPVNAADDEGCTPLMLAATAANIAMARLLLQRGADATLMAGPERLHRTALHMAVATPPRPNDTQPRAQELVEHESKLRGELAELLIDAGAKVDALDAAECTPLLIAVDERCRPAYLALQTACHARGIALTPRELMLMADRGVLPVAPQIAFTRLGKECVALRNAAADARAALASLQCERDALVERVKVLQLNQARSDERYAVLDLQLTEAREEIAALAERLAGQNARAANG